ncbi:MAG: anti-sigma factor family protein [Solirubrobacterales bacterium]
MTCKEFTEIVTDLIEGKVDPATKVEIDAHLAECDGCENYLDQMRKTIDALSRLATADGFAANRERALAAFTELRASR